MIRDNIFFACEEDFDAFLEECPWLDVKVSTHVDKNYLYTHYQNNALKLYSIPTLKTLHVYDGKCLRCNANCRAPTPVFDGRLHFAYGSAYKIVASAFLYNLHQALYVCGKHGAVMEGQELIDPVNYNDCQDQYLKPWMDFRIANQSLVETFIEVAQCITERGLPHHIGTPSEPRIDAKAPRFDIAAYPPCVNNVLSRGFHYHDRITFLGFLQGLNLSEMDFRAAWDHAISIKADPSRPNYASMLSTALQKKSNYCHCKIMAKSGLCNYLTDIEDLETPRQKCTNHLNKVTNRNFDTIRSPANFYWHYIASQNAK